MSPAVLDFVWGLIAGGLIGAGLMLRLCQRVVKLGEKPQ